MLNESLAQKIVKSNWITFIFFILILYFSFQSGFYQKTFVLFGISLPIGWVGTITGAVSWVATRAIQQKKNVGNWVSMVTNILSAMVSFFLGDYSRIFGGIPNLLLTGWATSAWHKKGDIKIGNNKALFYKALIFSIILELIFSTLAFFIFGKLFGRIDTFNELFNLSHGFTWIFIASNARTIVSYTAYLSQIFNTWHAQAMWSLYSIISLIQNILLQNVPSVIKNIGYVFTALSAVYTWKSDSQPAK